MAVSGYLWLRMMVVASSTVWRVVAPARTSGSPIDSMEDTYRALFPEGTSIEFQHILELKGLKAWPRIHTALCFSGNATTGSNPTCTAPGNH
ncbi:hypothetical protein F2Q69_00046677 [Brassica cretica]|uniref:Secreted protein n=1 Tax=Brassica cretica TaxID=69181 RepID=A0A8S9PPD7_BRACR|nr:hypothetical protein F2Q69_00046677 [Brassica cretica]